LACGYAGQPFCRFHLDDYSIVDDEVHALTTDQPAFVPDRDRHLASDRVAAIAQF
jgi:hypothetical protein